MVGEVDTTLPQVLDELGERERERERGWYVLVSACLSQRYLAEEGRATDEHSSTTETGLPAIFWRRCRSACTLANMYMSYLRVTGFVDMCVRHIPSPIEAATTKVMITSW